MKVQGDLFFIKVEKKSQKMQEGSTLKVIAMFLQGEKNLGKIWWISCCGKGFKDL